MHLLEATEELGFPSACHRETGVLYACSSCREGGRGPDATLCSGTDGIRGVHVARCVSQPCAITAFPAAWLYSPVVVACMCSTGSCLSTLSALGVPALFPWSLPTNIN